MTLKQAPAMFHDCEPVQNVRKSIVKSRPNVLCCYRDKLELSSKVGMIPFVEYNDKKIFDVKVNEMKTAITNQISEETGKNQQQNANLALGQVKAYAHIVLQTVKHIRIHLWKWLSLYRSLYDQDVLVEDTMLHWFCKGSNPKGSISLSMMDELKDVKQGGEAPKLAPKATQVASCETPATNNVPAAKPNPVSPPLDVTKQILAGINRNVSNNYFRADGKNTGNFIMEEYKMNDPQLRSTLRLVVDLLLDTSLAIVVAATGMFAAI
ncbi:hypothetical protein Tco_0832286 [Tanacetum coccineum]